MTRRPLRPAEVVLGLVDPADEPEVRRLLVEDPLFRDEVARLHTTAATLEQLELGAWRPEPPPPLPAPAPREPRRARPRRRLVLSLAGLAAAAAAAVAVVVAPGPDERPATTIALRPIGQTPGTATLTVSGRDAELRGSGMPPSGPHDYYEAWLADRRGRMISMGTFRVDARGRVDAHMTVAVRLGDYRLVDVSLEPDDGNPAHSATSVMRASL